eukprot:769996-Rhodomonas_salina.2
MFLMTGDPPLPEQALLPRGAAVSPTTNLTNAVWTVFCYAGPIAYDGTPTRYAYGKPRNRDYQMFHETSLAAGPLTDILEEAGAAGESSAGGSGAARKRKGSAGAAEARGSPTSLSGSSSYSESDSEDDFCRRRDADWSVYERYNGSLGTGDDDDDADAEPPYEERDDDDLVADDDFDDHDDFDNSD